jgi:hypothetical protein
MDYSSYVRASFFNVVRSLTRGGEICGVLVKRGGRLTLSLDRVFYRHEQRTIP